MPEIDQPWPWQPRLIGKASGSQQLMERRVDGLAAQRMASARDEQMVIDPRQLAAFVQVTI